MFESVDAHTDAQTILSREGTHIFFKLFFLVKKNIILCFLKGICINFL